MGCQCTDKEEESKNEILQKEKNADIEQYQEDNNNFDPKEGFFDLKNQNTDRIANLGEEKKEETEKEENNNQNEKTSAEKSIKYADYPEKMLSLINNIREDPVSYADIIEESIENIKNSMSR